MQHGYDHDSKRQKLLGPDYQGSDYGKAACMIFRSEF